MVISLSYIVVGIIAGFVASKLTSGHGKGCLMDLVLGIIGGLVGGWLLDLFGITWGGPFSNIGTAILGAVVVLWVWNKL